MANTITVKLNAEQLRWPDRCVCCGNADEIDVEVIVPDTVQRDRELSEISSAHIPHCHECAVHSSQGRSVMKIVALVMIVAFSSLILGASVSHFVAKTFVFGGLIAVGITSAVDRLRIRRLMRRTCSATGLAYKFIHPCSEHVTTINFSNDHFARVFRAVNLGGAYEP